VSQKEKNATPSKHDARSPIDPNAAAAAAAAAGGGAASPLLLYAAATCTTLNAQTTTF